MKTREDMELRREVGVVACHRVSFCWTIGTLTPVIPQISNT
jgi:hypothetical protein